MATKNIFVNQDHNAKELKNFSLERLSADPTGGNLYQGRMWAHTGDTRVRWYDGANTNTFAHLDDLEAFGALNGTFDPSGGAVPTTGSGISNTIRKGDYWFASAAGTITGITASTNVIESGDMLVAGADSGSTGDFYVVQTNLNLPATMLQTQTITGLNVPAGVATSIGALSAITTVEDFEVWNALGEKITDGICTNVSAQTITTDVALNNLIVKVFGY